ncbi:hypothetical protein NHX12_027677 [Muraenolepis orangiensis]|uniref:Ig-like domain-containing protein n=1 Tax=Muraenolepis orangiensis TaxID=630683 RepID=A0A9Q0ECQ4_9TELE|nr:hypothetical protein NHX12_027677 [Muraenolepis orangiensis]
MPAIGSCVTVPCNFTLEKRFEEYLKPECKPIWIKGDKEGPVLPDLTKESTGGMSVAFRGNLTAYDCTTTFYNVDNGSYYFRLDCPNKLKWTFKDEPLTIQFKGDLPAPLLTHPKEQVVEGTLVELGCSAPSPCHPHPTIVTWTPTLGLSTQLQRDNEVTSTLTFTASHRYHGNNVSCTAIYFKQSQGKNVTIISPRNTSVSGSPCHPAREGGCLNLTCTSHANPPVSEFTWYRIHGERILQMGNGSALSIQLFNTNNWFFCEVWNGIGTEKSNVYTIDIQSIPKLTLYHPSNSYPNYIQIFNTNKEDIYINTGVLMNTVGPREKAVGPREGAVGPREEAVGLREKAVGPREGAVGLREKAVGLREEAVGLREKAVG